MDRFKGARSIRWVVTGKSTKGKRREIWWEKKAKELDITIQGKWISKTAKENHPSKIKVCQVCGKERIIKYLYPTKNFVNSLNKTQKLKNKFAYSDFNAIDEIVKRIVYERVAGSLDRTDYVMNNTFWVALPS